MRSLSPEQVELIIAASNEGLSLFSAGALEEDARKFANQDPSFSQNPKVTLRTTLDSVGSDTQLKSSYINFVEDLVAGSAPDFDLALSTFTLLTKRLIDGLD